MVEGRSHRFTTRGVIRQHPVLRCSNPGCRVVWWPDRKQPAGQCRGRKPLEWLNTEFGQLPDCGECLAWLHKPFMAEAIASVSIETPGGVDVRRMVDAYHAAKHTTGRVA